jgi:hypothetical protein
MNNYIGLHIGPTIGLDISADSYGHTSFAPRFSYNTYGVYLDAGATANFTMTMIYNNSQNNIYLQNNAHAWMTDCYPDPPTSIGGPGTYNSQTSTPEVYNEADAFEVEYNPEGSTLRYDGWIPSGNDHYANTYCVLRRGHDYTILENHEILQVIIDNDDPPHLVVTGWTYDIQYAKEPIDSTSLLAYQSGAPVLSIPSNYPVLYCEIILSIFYWTGTQEVQSVDVYIIFDLPSTSGDAIETELPEIALDEYLYEGDDGTATNLPSEIDICGPYYRYYSGTSGWDSYYYGDDSGETAGLTCFDFNVVKIGCAAAYNCRYEWDAAMYIEEFVNKLLYGHWPGDPDWLDDPTYSWEQLVSTNLEHVTRDEMALDWANDGLTTTHSGTPDESDSLGLHCHDSPDGKYDQNEWLYQCQDYAAISTALDRSIGIAARQVTGRGYDGPHNWNYHVWTEAWIPDGGTFSDEEYENQWCVFDACGCTWSSTYVQDSDDDVYARNSRTGYYDNLNSDFGVPLYICIFFRTSDSQESEWEVGVTGWYF